MYKFRGSNPSQLTCRRWILDPNGCDDARCSYLHAITNRLSPPCAYACWAYNNGGCPKSQDECLYTHLRLDLPLNLSAMYPHLGSQDLSIALAAADAGFDCTDWSKLQRLLRAVRSAANFNHRHFDNRPYRPWRPKPPSSIYPDRWRPDTVRPRPGVAEAYRNADKPPAVPSFGKSAQDILRELDPNVNSQAKQPSLKVQPESQIMPQMSSKRNATGANAIDVRPVKRIKAESAAQVANTATTSQEPIIDLTQEIEPAAPASHTEQPSRYNLRSRTTNNSRKSHGQGRRRPAPKNIIQNDTNSIITRCAGKLRTALHGIGTDRESLRQRWEVDDDLKFQSVTDQLADLNDRFAEAEAALQAAVDVVERNLMARDKQQAIQ